MGKIREKKKILIFIGSMEKGGAERVISIIANYLISDGWDVCIAMLLSNGVKYELDPRISIVDLSFGGGNRLTRIPKWLTGIRKLEKDYNPDTVLSFVARINVLVQLACYGNNDKIIVSERNDPYMDGRSKLVDLLTGVLYKKSKRLVLQTKRASEYFKNIPKCKKVIIPNPIDIKCIKSASYKGKIVSVGRLSTQKNHKMLIDAFYDICNDYPFAQLYIYGEGELREELQGIINSYGVSNRVFLPGAVNDIHEKISDAEVFVLPSNYEGLSNALLEAMMMGHICISTNCAGSDEYIRNNENGMIIDVGDKNALIEAIKFVFDNPEIAKKMGEKARDSSKEFERDVVMKKWLDVIK